MKTILFLLLIQSINVMSQSYLSKNWMLLNKSNSPLISNYIGAIFEDNNNTYWISSVDDNSNGKLQSYRNGIWTSYDSTNSPLNRIIITDISQTADNKLLFATLNNGLYIKSGNSWDSLTRSNSPLPDNFIFRVTVDNLNRYWLGIPNYGVAVYNNGNWTIFHDQNSFSGIGDFNFIEVDKRNVVWIGTDAFGLYSFDGNRWRLAIPGTFTGGAAQQIVGLGVDTLNQKWVTINFHNGEEKIARSISDTSFFYYDSTYFGSAIDLFSNDGVLVDKKNNKFFGTTNGLIKFNDLNWTRINSTNSPVPGNWFEKGYRDSKNNKIYLLSNFTPRLPSLGLIFYNEDSVIVTSVKENQLQVNNFHLSQNYPNPFNPVTTISFSVVENSFITLKVFDLLGNEVAELVNETKKPGNYNVAFDASKFSSGVYFYRLNQNGNYLTKKMILAK